MEKIKFVMTDTDTQVSAVCRRALEAKGIAVTVCEKNGTKALETLLAVHPQAVLLDAFMPDLDAITVKQRYEAQNTSSTHTTFFVTGAFQSEEMEQELLDSGFSFFFVKPFDESVLVSRVLKAAGNTMRPQVVSQDSDELTVTEILHQIGVPAHIKGYQFLRDAILLTISDHGVHQRRDQAALSRNRQAQHDHGQPRRARDPPRHRGRLGPRRRGHAEQLLWLHDPQPARQADEQ